MNTQNQNGTQSGLGEVTSNRRKIQPDTSRSKGRMLPKINQLELDQTKITNFLRNSSLSKQLIAPNNNSLIKQTSSEPCSTQQASRLTKLQQQLRQRDKIIQQLKTRKVNEQNKFGVQIYNMKQLKKKTKLALAKVMLQTAQIKRRQRMKKDQKLGFYTEGMKVFIEGEALTKLKQEINQRLATIEKLNQDCKKKRLDADQRVRNISTMDFLKRQVQDLKKELALRQKQLATYKDRLKLLQKQLRCEYYNLKWPIIYDRYQTLQLLGSGGFGSVYKCFDLQNCKVSAIKHMVFKSNNRDYYQQEKQDFFKHVQRQAEIQKNLYHPNIARFIQCLQVRPQANRMVFQVQYCNGPQLSVYLRRHQCLQQKQAKIIIKQLFSALDYLSSREQRIIHYDIKPSNIMFSQGVIKLLDFGLCKIMQTQQTRMELTSPGVGTLWYLPPQTYKSHDARISPKVDVWSVGIIFYELLYGQRPFGHGLSQTQFREQQAYLEERIDFPKTNHKGNRISQQAKKFILSCLEKQQKNRLSPHEAYEHPYLNK